MLRRRAVCFLAFAACLGGAMDAGAAERFPARSIHVVVPLSAGTGWDVRVRQVSEIVAKSLGVPVVVENRPGAGATIGAAAVARAAPDGYTLLAATQADQSIAPAVNAALPYDPARDFTPVAQILLGTPILLVNAELPAKSFQEFVTLAKQSPGRYSATSLGYGTHSHIIVAELSRAAGIDITHVPYKKGSDAIADVVGGRVSLLVDYYVATEAFIASGKLRPLLVGSNIRHRRLPDIPTATEKGIPRLAKRPWGGIVAPAGTPREIVERLNRAFSDAARSPAMRRLIEEGGSDVVTSSPEVFGLFLRRDREEYARIVQEVGIKAEP